MLKINKLIKYYDKNLIFDNVCFNFDNGKIYGIIGENGIGKTTLLDCISNKTSYNGLITYNDNNKYQTSYITCNSDLPEFLTPIEFFEFLDIDSKRILKELNIKEIDKEKIIKKCSLGTKTKIQLYSKLESDSNIILLDETFANLDKKSNEYFINKINNIKNKSIIIIVSHDYDIINSLCDIVLKIDNNNIKEIEKRNLKKYI